MIATGRVAVNGETVTQLGAKADPDRDAITVDGRPIGVSVEKMYILLNKPPGYTSTRSDPHAERTVMELVADAGAYVYPVGRLDVDTSGLLILTNDGDFAQLLTHPSHQIDKTYRALVRGRITAAAMSALERGVELEDGATAPARLRLINYDPGTNASTVDITIHEGRKRQVRRMLAAVGHRVQKLSRIRLGNLDLKGLKEGQYRCLTKREVSELKRLAARGPAERKPAGGPGRR